MVCRKGPGLSIALKATRDEYVGIEINFKRGTQGAGLGNSKLGPGECAFIKRPVLKTEPNVLYHATDVALAVNIQLGGDKKPYFWAPDFSTGKRKGQALTDLKTFFRAINTQEYFTVDAYRIGAGENWDRFEISKFR